MSKPITVILQGQEILASFTDYDSAVREFRALSPDKGELSLHVLNRPDRKKGRPLVVQNVQPPPRQAPKRNKESLI
jgi:hypothetical protein